jgi:PAS domain S-box-containing protein
MESKEKANTQDLAIKEFISQFIPSKEGIPSVDVLISEVAKYYDADRAYIFERDLTEKFCINTYEWCAEGVTPEIQNLQEVSFEMLEPWWKEFRLKGCFFLSCDDEYAEAEPFIYEVLKPQGISTLMTAPFMYGNDMIGFLGVDNPKKNVDYHLFLEVAAAKLNQQILTIREKARDKEMDEAFDSIYFSLDAARWEMIFDKNGNMTSCIWSDLFRKMLGYQGKEDFPNELSSWSNLLHPSDKERVLEAFWAAVNDHTGKTRYSVKYRLLMQTGGYRWFAADGSLTRYENGMPKHYYGLFRDINEEVLVEQNLEKAKKSAEAANAAKTTFLFNMSHDIRTPMNAIIGFTDLLKKHKDDANKVDDYIDKIQSSSDFLLSLINNVLDMAKIESGKTILDESVFRTGEICEEVTSVYSDLMKQKNIKFTYSVDVRTKYIYGDMVKIRKILLNIVSNAYKYTPEGGTISISTIELPCDKEGYARIQTTFTDTGIGMSKEYLDVIFEEFSRERTSTESQIQGTGLGMSIVKKLVDLMGGTITVESELGKGSTFKVTFMFKKGENPNDKSSENQEIIDYQKFKGKRILLAEDNDLNAEIAMAILAEVGFEVERAEDGVVCVDMLQKMPCGYYDLIFMDVQMPNMDGYKATKTIRSMKDSCRNNIPIIAMTANAFAEDKQNAFEVGMDGHIAKPISVDEIVKVVNEVFNKKVRNNTKE